MGAAGVGQPQHRGRSAPPGDERNPEPPHQAPGNFPAVRAVRSRGKNRRMVRTITSFAVYDHGLCGEKRNARKNSRAYARGRHRPAANRYANRESALLETDSRIRTADWRAGGAQYIV